jgi:hypothetical protein
MGAYLAFMWVDSQYGTTIIRDIGWHVLWILPVGSFVEGFLGAMGRALAKGFFS